MAPSDGGVGGIGKSSNALLSACDGVAQAASRQSARRRQRPQTESARATHMFSVAYCSIWSTVEIALEFIS